MCCSAVSHIDVIHPAGKESIMVRERRLIRLATVRVFLLAWVATLDQAAMHRRITFSLQAARSKAKTSFPPREPSGPLFSLISVQKPHPVPCKTDLELIEAAVIYKLTAAFSWSSSVVFKCSLPPAFVTIKKESLSTDWLTKNTSDWKLFTKKEISDSNSLRSGCVAKLTSSNLQLWEKPEYPFKVSGVLLSVWNEERMEIFNISWFTFGLDYERLGAKRLQTRIWRNRVLIWNSSSSPLHPSLLSFYAIPLPVSFF